MLGGLYVLWMWPRAAPAAARSAARRSPRRAADLGRSSDWIVTGDPLHSLHGTADLAEAVDRRRDIATGALLDARSTSATRCASRS